MKISLAIAITMIALSVGYWRGYVRGYNETPKGSIICDMNKHVTVANIYFENVSVGSLAYICGEKD